MSKFNEYVKGVLKWNEDWKRFMEAEAVDEGDGIWDRLDKFTNVMETIRDTELSPEELLKIQAQVEELQDDMEGFFSKRQQIGSVFINEPYVAVGKHILPTLPYEYSALEPNIDREIMELHHRKHHQSYVDGLNKAELKLEEARKTGDFSLVKHWSRELAFHGSGHYLHTIFWSNMSPNGGGKPSGVLLKEIEKYFGSLEAFQTHFTEAAKQVEGSGWAVLVWSLRSRHLEILQSEKHMNLTQWDTIPILVLDVWEHAYYLQYKNDRAAYIKNWWNVVHWKNAEERLASAIQIKWRPY